MPPNLTLAGLKAWLNEIDPSDLHEGEDLRHWVHKRGHFAEMRSVIERLTAESEALREKLGALKEAGDVVVGLAMGAESALPLAKAEGAADALEWLADHHRDVNDLLATNWVMGVRAWSLALFVRRVRKMAHLVRSGKSIEDAKEAVRQTELVAIDAARTEPR